MRRGIRRPWLGLRRGWRNESGLRKRDFVDVYLIWKKFDIRPEDEEKCILSKINFSLKLYAKYRDHLKRKVALLDSGKLFEWGAEKELLLADINEGDFYEFLTEFGTFLKKIVAALGY